MCEHERCFSTYFCSDLCTSDCHALPPDTFASAQATRISPAFNTWTPKCSCWSAVEFPLLSHILPGYAAGEISAETGRASHADQKELLATESCLSAYLGSYLFSLSSISAVLKASLQVLAHGRKIWGRWGSARSQTLLRILCLQGWVGPAHIFYWHLSQCLHKYIFVSKASSNLKLASLDC